MVAVPEVGVTRPTSERSVVVLPDPFGPRKPTTLPSSIVEAQVVDGTDGPEVLGEVLNRDDGHVRVDHPSIRSPPAGAATRRPGVNKQAPSPVLDGYERHRHRGQRTPRQQARRPPARPRRRGHHAVAQPVLPAAPCVAARARARPGRGARRPRRRRPPRGRARRPALVRRRQAPHPQLARARHPQPRGRHRGGRPAPARARLLVGGRLLRPARRRATRREHRRPATTSSPRSA